MSYSDLLKDPRWQRMRLEVLEAAEFRCCMCDDDKSTLHVHHTYYAKGKKPWEYPAESLLCVCETCHAEITANVTEIQRMVGEAVPSIGAAICGFARALRAVADATVVSPWIRVNNHDEASGVALFVQTTPEKILALVNDDGLLDARELEAVRFAPKPVKQYPVPDMCPDCNVSESGMMGYPAVREDAVSGGMYTAYYRCAFGHTWSTRWAESFRVSADELIRDITLLTELVEVPA